MTYIEAMKPERITSSDLVQAGLAAMQSIGKPLTKLASTGRAMLYSMPNGETVRIRTCNDHVLIVVSDRPTTDGKLNIQGTHWLLVVMPEVERTPGKVMIYLLPADEVEAEARRTHQEWLDSNPNTKGENRTWNLWFRRDARGSAHDYATKWARYRINTNTNSLQLVSRSSNSPSDVKTEVYNARKRISEIAGVPIEAVKVTINFED
jgi:hypothetical protein